MASLWFTPLSPHRARLRRQARSRPLLRRRSPPNHSFVAATPCSVLGERPAFGYHHRCRRNRRHYCERDETQPCSARCRLVEPRQTRPRIPPPGFGPPCPRAQRSGAPAKQDPSDRPNILWLVSEDNGPFLGCYGDPLAHTPDARPPGQRGRAVRALLRPAGLRAVAVRADHRHVCGHLRPGRAHARARARFPSWLKGFPGLPAQGGLLHLEQRQDRLQLAHQHEGGVERIEPERALAQAARRRAAVLQRVQPRGHARELPLPAGGRRLGFPPTDPAKVRIPPYQPDTPEMRADWARYYNHMR